MCSFIKSMKTSGFCTTELQTIATFSPLSLDVAAVAAQLLKKEEYTSQSSVGIKLSFFVWLASRLKGLCVLKMSLCYFSTEGGPTKSGDKSNKMKSEKKNSSPLVFMSLVLYN